jgi:hypothetical protein
MGLNVQRGKGCDWPQPLALSTVFHWMVKSEMAQLYRDDNLVLRPE